MEKLQELINDHDIAVLRDIVERVMVVNFKQGKSTYPPGKWLSIVVEEIGEVAQSLQVDDAWAKDSDKSHTYDEIIDLAAACMRWAADLKRNEKQPEKNLN